MVTLSLRNHALAVPKLCIRVYSGSSLTVPLCSQHCSLVLASYVSYSKLLCSQRGLCDSRGIGLPGTGPDWRPRTRLTGLMNPGYIPEMLGSVSAERG